MPLSLNEYEPDGVYPEGASYWEYGTSYSVLTASILESSLGSDFGITKYKGLMKSPVFLLKCIAPSRLLYNFFDCGDSSETGANYLLSWFALKTGNSRYLNTEVLYGNNNKLPRYSLPVIYWISKVNKGNFIALPKNWKGESKNPVAFLSSDENDYYFACKGGSGSLYHANLDAGSFVFETDKIRWSVDLGNQDYYQLESQGFDLWSKCQNCDRWKLLTKNNFGHSTITINNELHQVDSHSKIILFNEIDTPSVSIDLTPLFGKNISKAERTFVKPDNSTLTIKDIFLTNDSTKTIRWQMITTADVIVKGGAATLSQEGKKLQLTILSHPKLTPSIVSLYPPPLKLDKEIKRLKRIEIQLSGKYLKKETELIVELKKIK